MKLSEAIRLGAMLRPQGRGKLFYEGKTCALGAALDAIGAFADRACDGYGIAYSRWPILLVEVAHPIEGDTDCVGDIVWSLNDSPNKWSRERIADWIETLEAAQEKETGVSVEREAEPAVATVGAKRPTESLQS